MYQCILQVRREHYRHRERDAEDDEHSPGERLHEVAHISVHGYEEGEEGERYAQRGRKHRHEEFAGGSDGCMPARHAVPQFLHVVVDDDYRVVHHHAERHDECGERHRVQFHAEEIEHAYGREDSDRNAQRRHLSNAARHEQHYHHNHRDNRDEQLAQEVEHRLAHHPALVGDGVEAHIVGQRLLELGKCLANVVAHLHDVVARSHLYRQQHTFVAVAFYVFVLLRIFSRDACYVFQSHDVAFGVRVYNLFSHIALVVVRVVYVYRHVQAARIYTSAHGGEALQRQVVQNLERTGAVLGQLVLVEIYAYLLVLQAVRAQVRYRVYAPQAVLQVVYVRVQFAVCLLLALHRDEQGRGVGYVVYGLQRQHACRQLRLERLQAVLELAPEGVAVFHVVVQLDEHYQHAVLALRVRLLLVHLFVAEDEVLERFSHPLFHFRRRGSGVDCHTCALAHRELRHLVLRHYGESGHAQHDEHADKQQHDVVVAHSRLDERALYHAVWFPCQASLYMKA